MANPLSADTAFRLPDLSVVSASAGAGKTHTLTMRVLQFLLSRRIPHTQLRHILAITFTNNAANEMKQRILRYLKEVCVRDDQTLGFVRTLVPEKDDVLVRRAEERLDEILDSYSDLQVSTIDSFVIAVFQSAALDMGFNPETEVVLSADMLLQTAFEEFTRDPAMQAEQRALMNGLASMIERTRSGGYLWDPYAHLFQRTRGLYRKLRMLTKPLLQRDESASMDAAAAAVAAAAVSMTVFLEKTGLAVSRHFQNDLERLRAGDVATVMGRTIKEKVVNKPSKAQEAAFRQFDEEIRERAAHIYRLMGEYALTVGRCRYYPFTQFLGLLEGRIAEVSRREQVIALDDINSSLKDKLNRGMVPDIYFKLGETIHHYLIDEFQDTSPIQWQILKPLLEETLAGNGSVFVVGDTKQSIYGFRGADWRIMNSLMLGSEFGSVTPDVSPLGINYRSSGAVLAFAQRLFQAGVKGSEYADAALLSGLATFEQRVVTGKENSGYVRYTRMEASDDTTPEQEHLIGAVRELLGRGYAVGDIAILTPSNASVTMISAWLNQHGIPFVSHSNLDIRNRQAVQEILALVRFLDAPVDSVSFAVFLLGTVFRRSVEGTTEGDLREFIFKVRHNNPARRPLYKMFREQYPVIWERMLEPLFVRVGYAPLYDLVSDVFKIFDVFGRLPEEEAALVKLLEVVRRFEREGTNSVREFVAFSGEEGESDAWTLGVPPSAGAVTVMTVHKAKGLDFPAVVVYVEDRVPEAGNPVIEEEGDAVRLLYVDKSLCAHSADLRKAHDRALLMEQADTLNQLYVAVTRAKEEMHNLCVSRKEMKGPLKGLGDSFEIGTPGRWLSKSTQGAGSPRVALVHHAMQQEYPLVHVRRSGLRETERGDVIHRVLSDLHLLDADWRERGRLAVCAAITEGSGALSEDEISGAVLRFLEAESVRRWFLPQEGRRVMNEQEFVNAAGELFRCDRIVLDHDVATVIDFKTGGNELESEYRTQVGNYCTILKQVFPSSTVRGMIAYVDLKTIVEVTA